MKERTEQLNIWLTKTERELIERLAEELKGTKSQIIRLALSKYAKQERLKEVENAITIPS